MDRISSSDNRENGNVRRAHGDAKFFVRPRETHDVTDAFHVTCACSSVSHLARSHERGYPILRDIAPSCFVPRCASCSDACLIDAGGQPPGSTASCVRLSLQLVSWHRRRGTVYRSRNREIINSKHAYSADIGEKKWIAIPWNYFFPCFNDFYVPTAALVFVRDAMFLWQCELFRMVPVCVYIGYTVVFIFLKFVGFIHSIVS